MKPNNHTNPLTVLNLRNEIRELEKSPYVHLAMAEAAASADASRRLAQLRELEHRGRFLSAAGLRLEDLEGDADA